MSHPGRCYCGAITFRLEGEPEATALCHCKDCRLSSGAPVTAWAGFAEEQLDITRGEPKTINLAGAAIRSFCADCGTGLFYRNADLLPGIVEVRTATLADAESLPPAVHIQTAEMLGWMKDAHELPAFERFPQ